MEMLKKWFKSPLLMSVMVALIVLPCAWYTYVLFYNMSKEESYTALTHTAKIKKLEFELQLQSVQHILNYAASSLAQLSNIDDKNSTLALSQFDDQIAGLTFDWSMKKQAASNDLFTSHSNDKSGLNNSSLSLYSGVALQKPNSLLLEKVLNSHQGELSYLTLLLDLSVLVKEMARQTLSEERACFRFYAMSQPKKTLLFDSGKINVPCEMLAQNRVSKREVIYWLGHEFEFEYFNIKPDISQKTLSLNNTLAVVLILMTSLIIFYIYLSRRYEEKIESLLKERGQSLKEVRTEYSKLFMLSVDGIYRASMNGNLLKANPAYATAFGYSDESTLCLKVNNIGEQLHQDPQQYKAFIARLEKDQRVVGFEWQSHDLQGRPIWLLENAYLTRHENGEVYYEGIIADITDKKKAEATLKSQAQMDSLTGLLNRATFVDQISETIAQNQAVNSAIFFIDLDKFKAVNDQYGHHVGDELLLEFSRRLKACFTNNELISRLGGDEFAVFLQEVEGLPQLQTIAHKVLAGLRKPFAFRNGCHFKISASIGISMLDKHIENVSEGLKQADKAMYEVKRNGRSDFIIYNQGLNETDHRRSMLEKHLMSALRCSEIYLNYQPIVAFKHGHICGMEVLMRWHNEVLGEVSPTEFIPIAEQVNLIHSFSNWLIHHACHDLANLIAITGNHDLFISINISPKQLLSDQVCDNLLISLEVNNLSAKNIKLEITETAIYDQEESVLKQLRRIRRHGIEIYIDDFGTGYSSLERLIQYPFDGLKIDRSFVTNLVPGNTQDIILNASVKMAELLNLVVVLEGIENPFQYEFCQNLGCQYAQGYLFYHPVGIAEIHRLLEVNKQTLHSQCLLEHDA